MCPLAEQGLAWPSGLWPSDLLDEFVASLYARLESRSIGELAEQELARPQT